MYVLAREVFASPLTAMFATTILALSPFDILFAQTAARQYSFLNVTGKYHSSHPAFSIISLILSPL